MKGKLMLLLAVLFLGIGVVTAQTRKVTGTVISAEDGQSVIGASVLVEGTKIGTITNADGAFTLTNVPNSAKNLIVSFIGMTTERVAIKPHVTVTLTADSKMLDEVMVVAFGSAKKSAFTGSAKVVNAEKLEQSQVSSVTNALAGQVAGVQLTSSNGAPGSTSTIRIRGFSSINAGKDPLIILDGAPYTGDMANINPADIESMTVLKDAASNALYGARGSNGVIMITTKKAKQGEALVTLDAKWGGNTRALKHYNVITDPGQYYETHYQAVKNYYMNKGLSENEAWITTNNNLFGKTASGGLGYNVYTVPNGQFLIGQNGKLNPNATLGRLATYKGEQYLLTPDNWEDAGTRTGLRQEYNLSISSQKEKSLFYASLGYLKNEGITEASDMERITARLKAEVQAKKWLKVGANMSFTHFDYNSLSNNGSSSSTGNIWAFTTQVAPIYPIYVRTADGNVKVDSNGISMMDYGNGMNAGYVRPWISDANPILDSMLNTRNSEGNASTGYGYADINILKGLTVTVNGTYGLQEYRGTTVLNPFYGQFDSTGGTVEKSHSRTFDTNFQQLINYTVNFRENNNLSLLLGHESSRELSYTLGASKSQMFSQSNKELSGAVVDGQAAYSSKAEYNNEGYFFRAQYDFGERIFASGSFRRDASSRFAPEYRWGNFWSLGTAWIMSKESWFSAPWVQELKVKASIGSQGNDNIGAYRYTDVYDIINSAGYVGTSFASKGTRDITWETKTNFNAGFEFQLFNRLSGSLEYFYAKTTDMLFSFSVAPSLGYSSYLDNVGDLYNTGVELDLNLNIFNKKNFTWDVNFNATTLKNRITALHPDKKTESCFDAEGNEYKGYVSGSTFIAEGLSMYTWRYKDYAGVNEKGQAMWYVTDKTAKDADGNPIFARTTTTDYSQADYYVTNETSIPKMYGGFGTSLRFHDFDFAINFSYQLGGKLHDSTYAQFMASPTGTTSGYNYHADILDSWTPQNTESVIPRFCFGDVYSSSASTRFLTSASYLNIENINFGYTLPNKWTRKFLVNSLRLYLSAENVAYWSKRKGFDPRQSFSGAPNATTYSPMRTISGGLTVKF